MIFSSASNLSIPNLSIRTVLTFKHTVATVDYLVRSNLRHRDTPNLTNLSIPILKHAFELK